MSNIIGVVTSNISAEFLTPTGVPPWVERKALYVQALRDTQASLIGLQEVTVSQLEYLQAEFTGYTALSVPVVDPDPALISAWQAKYAIFGFSEVPSPYEIILFYHAATFALIEQWHWWLSPTPERPSIGFGNIAPRVLLAAHFRHLPTNRELVAFNTHIDHRCLAPMLEICRAQFATFARRDLPLLFMGDLNFNPTTEHYQTLMRDGWQDTQTASISGDSTTFLYDLPDTPGGRIDHILLSGKGLTAVAWRPVTSPDPTKRLSDHAPVYAELQLD